MYSLLIKKGTIIDGTGKPGFVGDVAVEGNKIVAVAAQLNASGKQEIDAQGLVVAPGFIDAQNHSDSYWQLFENPTLDSLITQGFTTILLGNCGGSLAPLLSQDALLSMQKWRPVAGTNIDWVSFKEYGEHLAKSTYGCNVGSLVGYGTLRRGLIRDQVRSIDNKETEILTKTLTESLGAGAFGLSTGLSYAHEIIITELEIYELAKVVAEFNGLLSVHMRSEGSDVVESMEEAIDLASHTDCRLKISHLKVRGSRNWHYFTDCLEVLETAYHRGLKISFDVYPYESIWHPLYTYLPKWAVEGGRKALLGHIKDHVQRKKLIAYLQTLDSELGHITIASTAMPLHLEGKTIQDVAKAMEISSEEATLEVLEKGGSEILVFDRLLDYQQVESFLEHPLSMVASDGAGFAESSEKSTALVHPRCFGTTQKFLSETLEKKKISLEEGIRKLTSFPASTIGITNRGVLQAGNFADIVIFDPTKLRDRATLQNPYRYSKGMNYVFVNGALEIAKDQPTGIKAGRFLKK